MMKKHGVVELVACLWFW